MKDILERIAETSFRDDSWNELRGRLLDCAEIIMNLRNDQAMVDWLARKEEREECAKVAESWATDETTTTCANIAEAIRNSNVNYTSNEKIKGIA